MCFVPSRCTCRLYKWLNRVMVVASSTPLQARYANCIGSSWSCTFSTRICLNSRSKVFITIEVSATGLKSLSSLGDLILATGTIIDYFRGFGTLCWESDKLKRSEKMSHNWSAQTFRSLPVIMSGPGLFLTLHLRSMDLTEMALIVDWGVGSDVI